MNLYNDKLERRTNVKDDSSDNGDTFTINVDMNEMNLTLFQVIQRTNKIIGSVATDQPVQIYFVSGFKQHNTYSFWHEYFDYLKSIPNPERITIIYRGYIHYENIDMFFTNCSIILNKDCKLIYDKFKLHDIMESLSKQPSIFEKFVSRFLGFYKNTDYIVVNDLNELENIGIKFQIF